MNLPAGDVTDIATDIVRLQVHHTGPVLGLTHSLAAAWLAWQPD